MYFTINKTLFIALLFPLSSLLAQSACDIPPAIVDHYSEDIRSMAVDYMWQTSQDTDAIVVPAVHFNTVAEGLSAILNSGLPEADSIFNIFCVHNIGGISSLMSKREMIVYFNAAVPWTQAWVNGNSMTGNAYIDSLVNTYGFEVYDYQHYPGFPPVYQHRVLIKAHTVFNIDAAMDAFMEDDGITYAEPNGWIGGAGVLGMEVSGALRTFTIKHEWADCFDGCDEGIQWTFAVDPGCHVQLTDRFQYSFFGIFNPPPVSNCNISTGTKEVAPPTLVRIFPNPSSDIITVEADAANMGTLAIIFDQYGRRVKEIYLNKEAVQVPINDLAAGMYWLQVSNRAAQPQKIVKL